MSEKSVVVVFTYKSIERIIKDGGTSSWRMDRVNGRQCEYVVCTRNAHNKKIEGTEAHGSAFLVGRVSDVVLSPGFDDRYLIQFSEFARVSFPEVWKGDRNPVRYVATLEELGIDFSTLKWEKISKTSEPPQGVPKAPSLPAAQSLTMAEAKRGLALTFGVAPEAIEITIRG